MNKVIILAAFIFGMSHTVDAQLKTNTSSTTQVLTPKDQQKLTALKSHLNALDSKEAWLRSDPKELEIANKNGWFTNAARVRKELKADINILENKTK